MKFSFRATGQSIGGLKGSFVSPRPDLDQGTDREADQHEQGLLLEMGDQPVENLREGNDSHNAADCEHCQDRDIQIAYRTHDVVVFAEKHQDETARNAWKDHRADCDCAADCDEPGCVRSGGRG